MVLLALSLARADDRFFPGEDDAAVHLDDLVARGVAEGRSGRLIVRADAADAVAVHPGVASVKARPGGVLFVEPAPGVDELLLARALHDRPDVAWAIPDLVVRLVPTALPDDAYVGDQWHLENTGQGGRTSDVDIDAETAWAYATGAGQLVAVLDSGVQLDHPDLSVIAGYDYVDGDDDPTPASDWSGPHGTGCSGVAAALMFEANPRLTAAQAREVLCDTAVRIDLGGVSYDADGRSPWYGCGRVDAGAAVAAVANEAPAAPVPAWTDASPTVARVVLAWSPAEDADGDALSYVVDVTIGGGEPVRTSLDGTSLDLTGTVAEGDVVTWSVAAVDPWGEGPPSEPVTFTVSTEAPAVEEPGGCGVVPPAGWVGVALAMLGARRRRGQDPYGGVGRT